MYLEEKYLWLHKRNHKDFNALPLVTRKDCKIKSFVSVIQHSCTVVKGRRFCIPLPDLPVKKDKNLKCRKFRFRKTKFQSQHTYTRKRSVLERTCKPKFRRLFVRPKKLFICEPRDYKKEDFSFDCSALYPKVYKHTEPDANFVFEHEEKLVHTDQLKAELNAQDNQDLDILTEYMEDNTPEKKKVKTDHEFAMDNIFKGDHVDLFKPEVEKDFSKLSLEDVNEDIKDTKDFSEKKPVKRFHSLTDDFSVDAPVRTLKAHLRHAHARKRQLGSCIEQQEKVLKRLKQEMEYYDKKTDKINDQLNLRFTIGLTANLNRPIPATTASDIKELQKEVLPVNPVPIEQNKPIASDLSVMKEGSSVSVDLRKKYVCSLCDKRFVEKRSMTDHVKAHTGVSYSCEHCEQRTFTVKKSFKEHQRWHSLGRPYYDCPDCDKRFEIESRLKTHQYKHREEKLKCRVNVHCTKTFTFEGSRNNHETYGHLPKSFQCATCDRFFQSPNQIRTHHLQYAHTGIRKGEEESI